MLVNVIEENVIYLLLIDKLLIMTYNAVLLKWSLCVYGTPCACQTQLTYSTVVFCGNMDYIII